MLQGSVQPLLLLVPARNVIFFVILAFKMMIYNSKLTSFKPGNEHAYRKKIIELIKRGMCAIQPMKKIFKHESLKNETLVSATGVSPAHTNYLKNICLKTQIIYYSALGC
ncbi:hypothetical protein ACT3CD_12535 [Geofilum sp. OHC36d9]|uniref:hypothetical protein n=1 Tax=Geofilum sp. OHC36d9 TaxID=3458413 RepID=UPI004034C14F